MQKISRLGILTFLIGLGLTAHAIVLRPGFDAVEYMEVLQRCSGQINHVVFAKTAPPFTFHKVYTSPEMGLHNRWEMWLSNDSTVMTVNLRGTVSNVDNGLENLYAAMIPAVGKIHLNDSTDFEYKLAENKAATVHAGWSIGVCSLIPDIERQIRKYYDRGIKQLIIEGHSQGGALAFLLRSHLYYRMKEGAMPSDMVIKTYCSAAPKPGNQYYAYDFNFINRDGWALTVVSSLDWVPESPFTVQRFSDMNEVNPFAGSKAMLKKMPFFIRWYLKHVYNRTNRATRKAQRRYTHYLGHTAQKFARKYAHGLEMPAYAKTMDYVSAGTPVVLVPDDAYFKQFANVKYHIFMHHFFEQYYYLTSHIYLNKEVQ